MQTNKTKQPVIFLILTIFFFIGTGLNAQELPFAPKPPNKSGITLKDIWASGKYFPKSVPGFDFVEGKNTYLRLVDNQLQEVLFETGELQKVILDYNEIKKTTANLPDRLDSYDIGKGGYVLLKTNTQKIFRRSSQAQFFLYNLNDHSVIELDHNGPQRYASFNSDGDKVCYFRDNNLYLFDIDKKKTYAITTDGKNNQIINGGADWVYEEEFSLYKTFKWSPDGNSILYLRMDESKVPQFTMAMHHGDVYPEQRTWKYPKVGETNSTVTVHVFDLKSKKSREIFDSKSGDVHVPRIYYTPNSEPLFLTSNRHQDTFKLMIERKKGAIPKVLLVESSDTYVEFSSNLTFLKDGSFLWQSDRSGFNHIYLFDANGKLKSQLTKGDYPVTSFYGYDEKTNTIFYSAAKEMPFQQEVYKLNLTDKKPIKLSEKAGTNSAVFNGDNTSFLLSHSTRNTPPSYAIYNVSGEKLKILEDNQDLQKIQKEDKYKNIEDFNFTTSRGDKLYGGILTPPGFNEKGSIQYPLMMFVYGGPGSLYAKDVWKTQYNWYFQMLAQQGYVVAFVDGRGTGNRGAKFQKQTYLQLGKLEIEDQISAAKYLGEKSYIDKERIGIMGWSYGGYMSSLAITKGANVFKLAVAVAPVTNWKWYDSFYTERYMRTLKENEENYNVNAPMAYAERLKGHYLLIHGSGDDNVHAQHAMEMANELIKYNKPFEFFIYPNRNHGIYGNNARIHLFNKITNFINTRL